MVFIMNRDKGCGQGEQLGMLTSIGDNGCAHIRDNGVWPALGTRGVGQP